MDDAPEEDTDIFVTASGNAQGWGTAVECQDDACSSTVPAHGRSSLFLLVLL